MTIEAIKEKIQKVNNKLEKISKIKEFENISDFLDKEVYPTFKETFNNVNFSGWRYDIESDGEEIWLTDALSQGSQSMSSWNGETFILANIPMIQEPDSNWFDIDDIEITNDERKKIAEKVSDFLNEKIGIDDLNNWVYASEVENTFAELYSEKYQKLFDEMVENEWDCARDNLIHEIDSRLDEMEDYYKNELEELQDELVYLENQE